jgi:hypothetical protein
MHLSVFVHKKLLNLPFLQREGYDKKLIPKAVVCFIAQCKTYPLRRMKSIEPPVYEVVYIRTPYPCTSYSLCDNPLLQCLFDFHQAGEGISALRFAGK